MDSTAICPSAAEWDRLIAGSAPEHEIAEILRHVDDCAPCQQRLDRRGNLSVLVEREALGQAGEEFGPAFYRVVGGLFATQRTSQSAEATSPLLNRLLEPLDDPRYLGRLGQYRVVSVVGQGGMGIVFRAFDAVLNRDVALKVLSPHLAHEAIARERFAREARAAAAIDHENVMPIYAVSEAAGLPCLVMPYLLGRSLAEKLERTGRLPLVEVLRIGMQTALGLAAAHERGVVHRDIKPSNLLLEASEERVKIADFGLATVLDGVSLTQTGTLAGTPEFMSPEQAHEARVDTRSDLFSLGSVLFLMVTGQSPFRAVTPLATLRRVCDDVPPRVTELSTEATAWLAAVIERLLQKDPADRYQSAAEVAESLRYQIAAVSQPRRPPPRRVSCSSPGTDLSVAMPAVASLRAPSSSPDETDPLVALNPNTIFSRAQTTALAERKRAGMNRVSLAVASCISLCALLWAWNLGHPGRAPIDSARKTSAQRKADAQTRQNRPNSLFAMTPGKFASGTNSSRSATITVHAGSHQNSHSATIPVIAKPTIKKSTPPTVRVEVRAAQSPPAEPAGPRLSPDPWLSIRGIKPATGPAGTPITIQGAGFAKTDRVRFFVGNASKLAQFTVISNEEINVTAPEWLRPGAVALIVIETPQGVTTSFPADFVWVGDDKSRRTIVANASEFRVVSDGGVQRDGDATIFVQPGGALSSGNLLEAHEKSRHGPYFVSPGATADIGARECIVYAEPGATLSANTTDRTQLISTPRITLSDAGVFVYSASPRPLDVATPMQPPSIVDITPRVAHVAETIVLRGKGLATASNVELVRVSGYAPIAAGFRVVSDHELRVEVPSELLGLNDKVRREPFHIIVTTKRGVTFTAFDGGIVRLSQPYSNDVNDKVAWIDPGGVFTGSTGVLNIRGGGTVWEGGGAFTIFVAAGGRLDARRGLKGTVYYEPGTLVKQSSNDGVRWIEAPHVAASVLDFNFTIINKLKSPVD